MVTAR